MHACTNVYLTGTQERALDALARASGTTRSAVLRGIIDRAVVDHGGVTPDAEASFGLLAEGYSHVVDELFADDPDLRIDR